MIVSVVLTMVSFVLDREKTIRGLKKGLEMFRTIALPFLNILIVISLMIYLVPPALIQRYLGVDSGATGLIIAALIGSVALIPGFVSYPIAAALLAQGASYMTVATFMTTLMMVGIVTLLVLDSALSRGKMRFPLADMKVPSFLYFTIRLLPVSSTKTSNEPSPS